MIAGLDDILRRILGLQKPPPDDAQPFVMDFSATDPGAPFSEDELPPMNDYELQRLEMLGPAKILPYVPGNYLEDDAGPGPIPLNNSRGQEFQRGPNVPLRRGNAKNGNGIDI